MIFLLINVEVKVYTPRKIDETDVEQPQFCEDNARELSEPVSYLPISHGISNRIDEKQLDLIVLSLRRAIIGQESDYNYKAVNVHSGALGFAQVMPFNIAPWSKEALGYEITPKQFLENPELQLKIIDFKVGQYLQNALKASNGDLDIAVMRVAAQWYSGNPRLYKSTKIQWYKGHPYPSINEYSKSVLHKFHQELKMTLTVI